MSSVYDSMSHEELYRQLRAGSPAEINKSVTAYQKAERQANALADDFARTLTQLAAVWSGPAGEEFAARVGAIGTHARSLATSYGQTGGGLEAMSGKLAAAQRAAEPPSKTDDHDGAVKGAIIGGVTGGATSGVPGLVAGGIIGAVSGHEQDKAEKEQARKEIAALVSGVADVYREVVYGLAPVPAPPAGLPTTVVMERLSEAQPGVATGDASGLRSTGLPGTTPLSTVDGPAAITGGPAEVGPAVATSGTDVSVQPAAAAPVETSLAGAGGGGLTAGPVSGLLGALGRAGATPGVTAGLPGPASGLAAQPAGGAAPLRTGRPGGTGRPGDGRSLSGLGRGGDRLGGARGGTASGGRGTTRGLSASGTRAAGSSVAAARGGTGPRPGQNPAANPSNTPAGGRSAAAASGLARGQQDEADEHSTWLTEDDLVWDGPDVAAPPVIGGTPPAT